MLVFNEMTARTYRITDHAQERWRERHNSDIEASLKAAVPYGAQFGEDFLLINADQVFVCKARRPYYMVVTVLNQHQAIANMQGIRAVRELPESLQPISTPAIAAAKQPPAKPAPNVAGLTHRIVKMSDEEIRELRDQLQGSEYGREMFEVQAELRYRKLRKHAEFTKGEMMSLKRAMRDLLGDEKTMEIYLLANSYREEERCKATSNQLNTAIE